MVYRMIPAAAPSAEPPAAEIAMVMAAVPRQMHTVTCAECGAETQVPFEPTEGRPVYCRDCYAKQKKTVLRHSQADSAIIE